MNKLGNYIQEIKQILAQARQKAYAAIDTAMVHTYWMIGRRIVEEEQNGNDRATYGKEVIKNVSIELTKEFGKGFSETNVKYFRQFFNCFPDLIRHSLCDKFEDKEISHAANDRFEQINFTRLNWTLIRQILRVTSKEAQLWYLQEAAQQNWSVRNPTTNCGC